MASATSTTTSSKRVVTSTTSTTRLHDEQESKSIQDGPIITESKNDYDHFFWTYTEEPHRTRRQAIIKAHPEVTRPSILRRIPPDHILIQPSGHQALRARTVDQIRRVWGCFPSNIMCISPTKYPLFIMAILPHRIYNWSHGEPKPVLSYSWNIT